VSRTFSALTKAGVPILEALEIVGDSAGNETVKAAFAQAQSDVSRGTGIASPLSQHSVIPPMMAQMIAVGEETGALDEMLDKIADFYEHEVEATVDQLTSLIEPLLIAVMGGTVGGMVVALYMPMFNIIKLIK
jgi:type IV pilus assembly protein PilC